MESCRNEDIEGAVWLHDTNAIAAKSDEKFGILVDGDAAERSTRSEIGTGEPPARAAS